MKGPRGLLGGEGRGKGDESHAGHTERHREEATGVPLPGTWGKTSQRSRAWTWA